MPDILHVIIKKEDAIEIIAEELAPIPEWQKEAVRKTTGRVAGASRTNISHKDGIIRIASPGS
ncbi:MAG: hypothetical protein ABI813_14530 [Bacteroidota bacterium]